MTDFSTLFRRHWPEVLRFSLYISGNQADAEDLASDAFLRAWMSPSPIRSGTVNSYLCVIVRNLYRDRLRRSGSLGAVLGAVERVSREPSEPSPGPGDAAAHRGELDRTLAAMRQLSESDREVLAMAAHMPYELISSILSVSVPAVKVRVHRARQR